MKSTAEILSPTRVRLAVEVPYEEIKPSLDAAYAKIGAQIRVPGFRPGKVPARIIDQRVGRAAVLEEAMNEVVPRKYVEAAREHELQALGQPEIAVTSDVTTLGKDDPLAFTAEVDVRPEITLPDLDGIPVSVEDVEVTDADIDEQLDALRERFGTLVGVERAVEEHDFVSIDLKAEADGEELEDANRKGISYEVGSEDLMVGLDAALIGANAEDTVTFQTEIQQGDLKGTQADVTAHVNSVKTKELPDVDDEFAQMASEFDTVDELREDLRTRLTQAKSMGQGAQARDKLIEHLIETVEFPLPDSAVQGEVDFREHEVVHSLNHDEELLGRYLELQGKTREEFTAELRESAEKSVRAQFILDAVADAQETQVGDAELTEYLVRQSARYEMAPQDFANQVMQQGNLPALVADVRRNKALAGLLETATVTDASGNVVDLTALGPQLADDAVDDDEDFVEE